MFYVYIYLDPRKPGNYNYLDYNFKFEPFYVGKGTKNRMYDHLHEDEITTHNIFKLRKIKKIIKDGFIPIILKIKENITEEEAFILENNICY